MSSELQHKLLNYKPSPPQGAWENIVTALDEGKFSSLPEKLFAFQQEPPSHLWSKIAIRLNTQKKIIPFYRQNVVKYAAAAILILAVFGTYLIMNKKTDQAPLTSIPKNETPQTTPSTNFPNEDKITRKPEATVVVKKHDKHISRIAYRPHITASLINIGAIAPAKTAHKKNLNFNKAVDRYMIYSDDEGHAMRLPKKMFDSFSCIEEEAICRLRILNLQRQMATTAVSSDFTGILELINNLKENQ